MKSILALLKALLALAFWVLVVIPGLAFVLTAVAVSGWRALVWVVDLLPFEFFVGDVMAQAIATLLAAFVVAYMFTAWLFRKF